MKKLLDKIPSYYRWLDQFTDTPKGRVCVLLLCLIAIVLFLILKSL